MILSEICVTSSGGPVSESFQLWGVYEKQDEIKSNGKSVYVKDTYCLSIKKELGGWVVFDGWNGTYCRNTNKKLQSDRINLYLCPVHMVQQKTANHQTKTRRFRCKRSCKRSRISIDLTMVAAT